MSKLPPQVETIERHEKCWQIVEFEGLTPDYKTAHRYQQIFILRDGEMRVGLVDMGPAIQWPGVPTLRVNSLGEDSVAECLEQIEGMRTENRASKILEERGPSTLLDDYRRFSHERWELMHNRSVFGPAFKRERNLFARKRTKYGNDA